MDELSRGKLAFALTIVAEGPFFFRGKKGVRYSGEGEVERKKGRGSSGRDARGHRGETRRPT